ncbi:MAG: hypothetical protein COV72_00870 [Candidatus Omnitrophica bacterium CG11_big_fil_rev_8_21_14_0_20_42_13]|uniref:Selenobiotic family radical SAM modification target peptide n=1 Tax=Candidatus Ghiorseimicrobium undicola TaxID=1974746 RepID=A0A2H0LZM6_9BACT|nr:MAG: hypothetical protein COV72_00870 [Candidatus Omnitrophica bacterium CG11_big_fil_rev_8_21_14_0_20_42_13]
MKKKAIKKALSKVSIAALIASIGLMAGGCEKKATASCGAGGDKGMEEGGHSCGKGSCGKGSCGK